MAYFKEITNKLNDVFPVCLSKIIIDKLDDNTDFTKIETHFYWLKKFMFIKYDLQQICSFISCNTTGAKYIKNNYTLTNMKYFTDLTKIVLEENRLLSTYPCYYDEYSDCERYIDIFYQSHRYPNEEDIETDIVLQIMDIRLENEGFKNKYGGLKKIKYNGAIAKILNKAISNFKKVHEEFLFSFSFYKKINYSKGGTSKTKIIKQVNKTLELLENFYIKSINNKQYP